jgi:hypothetical protein
MQKDNLRDFAAHLAFFKSLRLLTFFERANKPSFAEYCTLQLQVRESNLVVLLHNGGFFNNYVTKRC